jgi:DNA polymerase-4
MPPPELNSSVRRIIHIDMDAFYASVEQRDDPSLRGVPLAVGGSKERGVVAAASYEARNFGVHSAMASVTARRKCPDLVFVRPRFDVYKAVSQQIHEIFARYTPLIQPLSLDEAYLDVTEPLIDCGSATAIAEEIRAAIRGETSLTASAGVSYNKFLAKLASDHRKPDGLFVITPRMGLTFVEDLPVGKFHGVGPVTAARMNALGIRTGLDLRRQSRAFLVKHFGKAGDFYHGIARAEDHRPVNPDRQPKSLSAETTFDRDLGDWEEAAAAIAPLCAKVWAVVCGGGHAGRTVTIKVKYSDFRQITRSRSSVVPVASLVELKQIALDLLRPHFPPLLGVRLLGVTLSTLDADSHGQAGQLALVLAKTGRAGGEHPVPRGADQLPAVHGPLRTKQESWFRGSTALPLIAPNARSPRKAQSRAAPGHGTWCRRHFRAGSPAAGHCRCRVGHDHHVGAPCRAPYRQRRRSAPHPADDVLPPRCHRKWRAGSHGSACRCWARTQGR